MEKPDKIRVLIAEDNPVAAETMKKSFKKIGLELAGVATNGIEAIKLALSLQPDVILMDIMMPEMDGLEACRRIQKHEMCRNVPVIFITALADTENIVKAFAAGGVDYITKPFIKEEVQARIMVHLKLKKAMDKLAEMSVTDEMTGVYNRRHAFQVLSREMSLAKRKKKSFVICYVDIDNLKTINDAYGHNAGDQLITEVVNGFKKVIRSSDYLFRMGGDEFMLVFPESELADLDSLVNRLRQELHQKKIRRIPIDFSFGFSKFDPTDNIAPEKLIKKADRCMYVQKMNKKNTDSKHEH